MIFIILSISLLAAANLSFAQLLEGPNHPCYRVCQSGSRRLCEYDFGVELYQTMTDACFNCPGTTADCSGIDCIPADGFPRLVQVVNRKMPGPSIEVCEGDEVLVRVHNEMRGESTSIHWHGMHMLGTQFMDGVPFVTQCPINPETSFEYRFRAKQAGTHFWHSHTSVQRGNGLAGALIIRKDPNLERNLFDFDISDHVVFLQDWTEHEANHVFIAHYHDRIDEYPRSILVNGLGRFTNLANITQGIPAERFVVRSGFRHRFRVIGSSYMDVPISLRIDGHSLTIIASDGADCLPVTVDTLTVLPGERYDFVLNANQRADLYWMRLYGLVQGRLSQVFGAAVIQYEGQSSTAYPLSPALPPTYNNNAPQGRQLNGINLPPNNVAAHQLKPVENTSQYCGRPDYQIYVTFDIKNVLVPEFQLSQPSTSSPLLPATQLPQLNNISLKLYSFPLLSQWNLIPNNSYCNRNTVGSNCVNNYCACPHIIPLQYGKLVELIFVDEGRMFDVSHPFHLHGQYMAIMGAGKLGSSTTESDVWNMDNFGGGLNRNLINPPLKDTIPVPDGGYVVARFFTRNRGFWLMHCHLEFHMELGMGLVFQVGNYTEMPIAPPGFPRCGDYKNNIISPL